MARKKKPPPAPEPAPELWEKYKPWEPLYWALGGPFIPPEEIKPLDFKPGFFGGHCKSAGAKRAYLVTSMEAAEEAAKKNVARYLELKAKGMDAISPWIVSSWQQTVHGGGALCQSKDGTIKGKPDPVSEYLAIAFRDIAYERGRYAACEAELHAAERLSHPLLFLPERP